jgi:hypothetical protein
VANSQQPQSDSWAKGWAIVIIVSVAIIGWFFLNYFLLGSKPPGWTFGSVPSVPAESRYSTEPQPKGQPRQVELAPPVREMKR